MKRESMRLGDTEDLKNTTIAISIYIIILSTFVFFYDGHKLRIWSLCYAMHNVTSYNHKYLA